MALDPAVKTIQSLIDDCIEEKEYEEAFTLFIKFVRTLDEESRNFLFDRYYKMLDESSNFYTYND
jgi:hypothetical protein|uniref:Uncharacterized protein n=1 Tax=viral metagenome TaxID=1070528 RepID=A0A6C0HC85_9ZZZZ